MNTQQKKVTENYYFYRYKFNRLKKPKKTRKTSPLNSGEQLPKCKLPGSN